MLSKSQKPSTTLRTKRVQKDKGSESQRILYVNAH